MSENHDILRMEVEDANERLIHEPRCNTNCAPGGHYLSSGIGLPHLHRTDLRSRCGECRTSSGEPR